MKKYITPHIYTAKVEGGIPTVLAIAAVSAAGAAAVAASKLIGDDRSLHKNSNISNIED